MAPDASVRVVSHINWQFWGSWFDIYFPKAAMDTLRDLLGKLLDALPLKNLSANQVFDLACDCVMLGLVAVALVTDLGSYQQILKIFLILCSAGIVIWSFAVNRR
jgi:hypothetical protein